jgi:hypothetical protein
MRIVGDRCRRYGVALAAFAAALACSPAQAEWSASLPGLAACTVERPELPARWRAVALMMPFHEGQLDVGEFVYDSSLPAMRASIYGLESGAVDLLITDGDTYRLTGPHRSPTECTSLGRRWRVPPAHWLRDKAVCIGRKKLAARVVQWWKTPGSGDQATYHWFTANTRLPWRSLFQRRTTDLAVIGDYAMIHYPEFAPLAETNLSSLLGLCRAEPIAPGAEAAASIPPARELMGRGNEAAEAEREQRIGALIPGLGLRGCERMTAVRWPDKYIMTAMLTPIRFEEAPYSSIIYYDWQQAETQLVAMFQGQPPKFQGVVSLQKGIGYRVEVGASRGATCDAVFPGMVRPDWMSVAGCRCRGRSRCVQGRDVRRGFSRHGQAGLDVGGWLPVPGYDRQEFEPRPRSGDPDPVLSDQASGSAHHVELVHGGRAAAGVLRGRADRRRRHACRHQRLAAGPDRQARGLQAAAGLHAGESERARTHASQRELRRLPHRRPVSGARRPHCNS